ncbi:ABC transporter ATP-binding protein [Gilliamella apicola]|uniref:ABC transporter ATP-binding protein n=1 Tax=Gilliamella apicola TaxID=1196095 RepID=UPI000A344B8A|nr:ABC transporter ATP-binding protein [Gilliamella apicola]OTQ29562.1 ABC transporter ATP-binding protein [Gilliamella apicola]
MIKVGELQLTFNQGTPIENHVLRGLNLNISEGEFVTIIGSNGAGKSSLLNVISGDLLSDSGSVIINRKNVTRWPAWKRAGLVARVFQDPMVGTCENLTIEENLAIAYNRGHSFTLSPALNRKLRTIFKEKLATLNLGLENRLSDMMGLLSGGQRQAVSLLMSTLQPSKILLLDEHTAALDPKTAQFVLELTDQIVSKNHLTTMMVTHSMKQALEYGSRTVMLHQGQVVLDVSGEERTKLTVNDLLAMFEKTRGEKVTDDALLLG